VNQTVRQYLVELEQQNPTEEPVHQQDQVSTTDPDATYATKGGTPARLGYYDNYLVDNHSCVIVGVQATAARMSQETVAAQDMLARFAQWQGREPESVAADTTYGNGEFLQWLADRSITPYMRTRDSIHRKRSPFFGPERFTYEPENNRYICPAGQFLNYGGRVYRNRAFNYIGTRKSVARARSDHNAPVLPSGALSSTRTNQPDNVRGSWSTRQSSPKHSGKERRWKPCSRTEESDRIAALASAQTQVRARAVLPGSGSSEHQATGALPQSADNTGSAGHHLVERRQENRRRHARR
jgi:Transposase DDE domain.